MDRSTPILRYVLIGAIFLILIALLTWYAVLRGRTERISEGDAGRGAGLEAPSFGSALGSTYENIIGSLSTLVGERDEGRAKGLPRLSQVSSAPVAGAAFVQSATSTMLRFVERSSGYVLESSPETGGLVRRTNTLIPRVYEAFVLQDEHVLLRKLGENDEIITTVNELVATSTSEGSTLATVKRLPDNVRTITVSPTGLEIFYIHGEDGGFLGVRAGWDGAEGKSVFASMISGWRVHWVSPDRILLTQNVADGASGNTYELSSGGALLPLVRNIPGLTILPHPSSRALLYGSSAGGNLSLFARTNSTSSTVSLPVRTVADKCVWDPGAQLVAYCAVPQAAPPANFLDHWYRGEVHTSDSWWKIDVGAATAELLYAPGNLELDVEHPTIDRSGKYIVFLNARDKSLWLLRIEE